MIRITVYAGYDPNAREAPGESFYEPSVTTRVVAARDVHEELRILGHEWRQADYFPTRQTIITLDPVPEVTDEMVERAVGAAFVPPISDDRREDMRAALLAALGDTDAY